MAFNLLELEASTPARRRLVRAKNGWGAGLVHRKLSGIGMVDYNDARVVFGQACHVL
jgi:hypothetical protein